MKPVRIGNATYLIGELQCLRCGLRVRPHVWAHGIIRLACSAKGCEWHWVAIRLPPGVTGRQLVDIFGMATARALLGAVLDVAALDDQALLGIPLPSLDYTVPCYVQRAPDAPEPSMGWAQAQTILTSIMGSR